MRSTSNANGYTDDELGILEAAEAEALESDPVHRSVTYKNFLSKSKGRGRERKRSVEVELVGYDGRFHTWDRCPFDEYASEIYGHTAEGEEERLKREIPERAKR